jgi:hypothetical protein
MSVTVAGIEFDHHVYDERADVLYLTVAGYEGPRARLTLLRRATESSRREAPGDRDDTRERQVAARP